MKYILILFCFSSSSLCGQAFNPNDLLGIWQNEKDSSHHEIWELKGDTMEGRALEIKMGKKEVWETLKIYAQNDKLVYIADVSGNGSAIEFKESKSTPSAYSLKNYS